MYIASSLRSFVILLNQTVLSGSRSRQNKDDGGDLSVYLRCLANARQLGRRRCFPKILGYIGLTFSVPSPASRLNQTAVRKNLVEVFSLRFLPLLDLRLLPANAPDDAPKPDSSAPVDKRFLDKRKPWSRGVSGLAAAEAMAAEGGKGEEVKVD